MQHHMSGKNICQRFVFVAGCSVSPSPQLFQSKRLSKVRKILIVAYIVYYLLLKLRFVAMSAVKPEGSKVGFSNT